MLAGGDKWEEQRILTCSGPMGPERRAELLFSILEQDKAGREGARAFELSLHRSGIATSEAATCPGAPGGSQLRQAPGHRQRHGGRAALQLRGIHCGGP